MAAAPTRHIRGPSVAMPDGAGAAAGVTSTDHWAAASVAGRPGAVETAFATGAASQAAMAAGPTRHMRIEVAAPAAASTTRAGAAT